MTTQTEPSYPSRAYAWYVVVLLTIAYAISLPAFFIGFWFESRAVFLSALGIGATCLFLCMPAVNTQIANVVRPDQRAMAYAQAGTGKTA